jgi:hypothetical protein
MSNKTIFKVGDKVRYTGASTRTHTPHLIGQIGYITTIYAQNDIRVDFHSHSVLGENLELVEPKKQYEVVLQELQFAIDGLEEDVVTTCDTLVKAYAVARALNESHGCVHYVREVK